MLPRLKSVTQDSGRTSDRNVFLTQTKPNEMTRSRSVMSHTLDAKSQMEKDVEYYIKSLNQIMKYCCSCNLDVSPMSTISCAPTLKTTPT